MKILKTKKILMRSPLKARQRPNLGFLGSALHRVRSCFVIISKAICDLILIIAGHAYFVEVPEEYIDDQFNMTGLSMIVPYYTEGMFNETHEFVLFN